VRRAAEGFIARGVAVGLVDRGEPRVLTESDVRLKTLAQETGGRSGFPIRLTELAGVYRAVADELSSLYALGDTPKGAPPARFAACRLTSSGDRRMIRAPAPATVRPGPSPPRPNAGTSRALTAPLSATMSG
jgi:hypothetical protein